jgi:hypothetical protein
MKFHCNPRSTFFLTALALVSTFAGAQQAEMAASSVVVPRLVNFSGKAGDVGGKIMTGTVGVTFALYKDQEGGSPLWLETQNVQADAKGNYNVQLGATKAEGLPLDLFSSGEARWLGVTVNGGTEQSRVLLLSVPYALKAADAQTVGGLPPSAFVLANNLNHANAPAGTTMVSETVDGVMQAVSGTGTTDFLPLWTNSSGALGNSVLFQSGAGTTAKIGINTTAPAVTLDVNGGENVHGVLNMPITGNATSSGGKNSQPLDLTASAFNSSSNAAVTQKFQWQTEPVGNNTASPSGALSLLFASGSAAPAETGLKINNKGQMTFASGQTFPIASGSVTDAMLQHASVTVKAGTDLTGGGTVSLGGTTTLNLDTTKVPQLAAANKFTNQNTINVNTVCNASFNCFPGLTVNNTGGSASASGGDGIDINTGESSLGLRVNGGSEGILVNSGFAGGIIEGNGGGGVYGDEQVDADFLAGVNGFQIADSAIHQTIGVFGFSSSPNGFGVYGEQVEGNQSGQHRPAGVWGDSAASAGVFASSDDDDAIAAVSADKNGGQRAGFFDNLSSNANEAVLVAEGFNVGGMCSMFTNGNLECSGTKSAVVPVSEGARRVALYAIEGPENWFEDAGSGQLANGMAVVNLEPIFGETVNTNMEYRVFLTPNGDCKGLYVAQKSANSFVVRELGGGASNISFDYRIMAKRKGYENVRLADRTATFRMSETPNGMRKGSAVPVKMPPSAKEIREKRLKLLGIRPVARLETPATNPSVRK